MTDDPEVLAAVVLHDVEQYWYYHSIQEALSDLKNTAAWREYARYIREIFHSQPRME